MSAIRASYAPAPRKTPGTWLSLFAMLMIFIGPLISQAMPIEHHTGMAMSASMSADMDMSAPMDMSSADHSAPLKTDDSASVDHVIWAKCGYCTLLFNCPALTQTLAVISPSPPKPADFYSAAPLQGHAQRTVFPNARSRAPPLSPVA